MCDKANSSMGCDVVYDLELEIDNLNDEINKLKEELWKRDSINVKLEKFEEAFDWDSFANNWGRY